MYSFKKYLEDNFLKIRYVFRANMQDIKKINDNNLFVNVIKIDLNKQDIEQKHLEFLRNHLPEKKLAKRINNPLLCLYLAVSKETSQPVGYYWVVAPDTEPAWHDKYCVRPGEAFGFDAFVLAEYRGKGVFPSLKAVAVKDITHNGKCKELYSVVERSNVRSIQANKKIGIIIETNILIKFFKRNIISVYIGKRDWRLYYVFRNYKSHSL